MRCFFLNNPLSILATAIFCGLFLCMRPLYGEKKSFKVVIDAGHGGKDPGALGVISKEKDINLAIALKLGKMISNNTDAEVIYTRKDDRFVALDERANIANCSGANLFISLHVNALKNKNYQGTETYTLGLAQSDENLEVAKRENAVILLEDGYSQRYEGFEPNSSESYIIFEMMQDKYMKQSIALATNIQHNFSNQCGRIDRGVKQAGFLVLRNTGMPSVLVEVGYISNRAEERYLNTEKGQKAIATSIYNGFVICKNEYEKSVQGKGYVATKEMMIDDAPDGEMRNEKLIGRSSEKEPLFLSEVEDTPKKHSNEKVYKIQIIASVTPIKAGSSEFKGLKDVECYQEKGWYKYTYGSSKSLQEIKQIKRQLVDKKFKQSFIVAFRGGEKIE